MALRNGWPAVSGAPTFSDIRHAAVGRYVRTSTGGLRAGVLPSNFGALVGSRASMGVNVASFRAVLDRDGAIEIENEGASVVPLDVAPGANSRIDVIYVQQRIASLGDAADGPVFGVVKGNAAAIPSKPSVDAIPGALELAAVTIPSSATTTQSSGVVISQTAPFTASAGGVVQFRSIAELRAADVATETLGSIIGSNTTYRMSASGWMPYSGATFARRENGAGATHPNGAGLARVALSGGSTTDGDIFGLETSTIRVKVSGWYRVTVNMTWSSNDVGRRTFGAYVDRAELLTLDVGDTRAASGPSDGSASALRYLDAGMAIAIYASHTAMNGATPPVAISLGYRASLSLEWVTS